MTKQTTNNPEQGFIYQLGQDVAKLGTEIESLKNKTVKAVRIVVPAKPEKYQQYTIKAVINLPLECQNAICIKSQDGDISLIETGETMSEYARVAESAFYLAPIYRLVPETINATLDQDAMRNIDEQREHQERERKEQQERAERDKVIYKYLVKWLTDNYLEAVRAKAKNPALELQGFKVYVNKNGLRALLDKPFERNSHLDEAKLDESIYADAKTALLTEKARIDRGDVDLSVASNFEVVDYHYFEDIL